MTLPLASLAAALAWAAHAAPARVELVPERTLSAPAPSAAAGAASLQPLTVPSLAPAASLAAPALAAPALAARPVAAAAAAPAKPAEPRPLLIKTLAAPALDVSALPAGESGRAAEADFNARAQLDGPPARGESRLLVRGSDGRWLTLARPARSPAAPTAEEVRLWSGRDGRAFIASPSGLLEWNTTVPESAAGRLSSALSRLALRVPWLSRLALARAGVAARRTSWARALEQGLDAGEAPLNEEVLVAKTIPALAAAEFPEVAARLGRTIDAAYAADVLARTKGYRMYWHSASTYKDHPDHVGIPDGHFRPDFGIRLMVKPDWRRLKDLPANYRPLFAHEYVHWLQHEGFISEKYGAEVAAVAVEVLRAVELVGLDEVRAGRAGTVHAGVLSSFDGGREWARGGFKGEGTPYLKGALAGAAWEAAAATGRPGAAWEFLNLVIAGEGALEPAAAWARVTGGAR